MSRLISQFFCNLNSSKKFTCPSGKLITEFTSQIAKSASPGISDSTFFARCNVHWISSLTVQYNVRHLVLSLWQYPGPCITARSLDPAPFNAQLLTPCCQLICGLRCFPKLTVGSQPMRRQIMNTMYNNIKYMKPKDFYKTDTTW